MWKAKHPQLAKELQRIAEKPRYYQVNPDENVKVNLGSEEMEYTGTIRALFGAPNGPCTGTAKRDGAHPFTCDALPHAKSSSLYRKLSRNSTLKHPRSDEHRAESSGVNHKFCSSEHLQNALQSRKMGVKVKSMKVVHLSHACQKLLHDSWHGSQSAKPFIETLMTLFETNKL